MDSNHLIDALEEQLVIIRRRIEKLSRMEKSVIEKLDFVRIHSRLNFWLGSLGCKKIETAWRKFKILEYIDAYDAGLSAGELQEKMPGHGMIYNYSTIRVEITRLRQNGLLTKTRQSRKWTTTREARAVLDEILNRDGKSIA